MDLDEVADLVQHPAHLRGVVDLDGDGVDSADAESVSAAAGSLVIPSTWLIEMPRSSATSSGVRSD